LKRDFWVVQQGKVSESLADPRCLSFSSWEQNDLGNKISLMRRGFFEVWDRMGLRHERRSPKTSFKVQTHHLPGTFKAMGSRMNPSEPQMIPLKFLERPGKYPDLNETEVLVYAMGR